MRNKTEKKKQKQKATINNLQLTANDSLPTNVILSKASSVDSNDATN